MKENRYIAAVEISSSKVIGAVGRIDASGKLHVVAIEQEKTVESVRYGIIQNMIQTTNTLNTVLRRLESRSSVSPRRIKGVYLGLSGRSLCNIPYEVSRNLADEIEITPDIIEALNTEAKNADINQSLKIVDVQPRTYFVNNSETQSPIGTVGNRVRAEVNLLVCRPPLERNAVKVLTEKAGLQIDGIIVTPIATANMVLTDDDRRMGCMLVDMGAETTTVSIYKNGYLHYMATLPMGSRNITRDITTLGVVEEKAESIKISSGHATEGFIGRSLQIEGIKSTELAQIVVARSEEIVTNIIQQIEYADMTTDQLKAGIIMTGGGFRLNRIDELLSTKSRMKVRNASSAIPANIDLEDTKVQAYESIQVISLLVAAANLNDRESLETPKAEPLNENGEANDLPVYGNDEQDEKKEKDGGKGKDEGPSRRSRLIDRMRKTVTKFFESNDDEDDEDMFAQ